jgi:hypothetical protein
MDIASVNSYGRGEKPGVVWHDDESKLVWMARIGILTYHFSDNFGAVLQAYALRQWLLQNGHEAEIINYHPRYVEEGGNFRSLLNRRNWKPNLKILYLKLSHLRKQILRDTRQIEGFLSFRTDVLQVRGPRIERESGLKDIGKYDMLVCGSDQIWNPSLQKGLDPAYFLDFSTDPDCRRISYAASFGKSELDPAFWDEARQLLSRLHGISVREKSGAEIVKAVSKREAACVPDPTILLGDFGPLTAANPAQQQGHIFCYALRTDAGVRPAAMIAAARNRAEILSPFNPHRRWREIGKTMFISPGGWLSLLDRASFVVTNSFHGLALSALRNRPFVVTGLPGAKRGLNERASNLLTELGLTDRFLPADQADRVPALMERPIDWAGVNARLAQLRADGEKFLRAQLAEVAKHDR